MGDGVKLDSFGHVGLVVKDLEATVKTWSSMLGAGPWEIKDVGALKLGFGKLAGTEFELIEPVKEGTLWADFLKDSGEGLHHMSVKVADVDDAVAKLVAEGGEAMVHTPGTFAYVRTGGPGSIILELSKTPGE